VCVRERVCVYAHAQLLSGLNSYKYTP